MCHKQGSGILHKIFVIHFCIDLLHVTMKGAKKRRNSIIDVCARFPIWESIKEASKLWPNELGLLNFLKILKIPKVLLTKSRFFSSKEYRTFNYFQNLVQCFFCSLIGGDIDYQWRSLSNGMNAMASLSRLCSSFITEWNFPIWHDCKEIFIYISQRFTMSQQEYISRQVLIGARFFGNTGRHFPLMFLGAFQEGRASFNGICETRTFHFMQQRVDGN
mmetsp:Transcript_31043/g.56270  ORF Transcript_31043/g.56270 Transcript_31043/m.56270 type:complete len:218 (+) Transcript_31043:422-1075(+)